MADILRIDPGNTLGDSFSKVVGDTLYYYGRRRCKFTFYYNNGTSNYFTKTINLYDKFSFGDPQVKSQVREGYTFLGWSRNQTDAAPLYNDNSIIVANTDMSFYAMWSANPVILSGLIYDSSDNLLYGSQLSLDTTNHTATYTG